MSAFMISFSIHLAILVLAFSFVALTVIEKKDRIFLKLTKIEAIGKTSRKLRVPVELEKKQKQK